jgi:pSer/pThr/pTyr-binding forkhead associated (FHA) protein
MPSLQILKGPNEGAVIPLEGDRFVLGRNPDCGIVIPVTSVSREHAQILRVQGRYFIEDKQSRNGTFVNNQAINARTALKNNDRIRICDFIAAFLDQAPSPDQEDDEGEGEGPSTVEAMLNHTSHLLLETQPAEKLRLLVDIANNLSKSLELQSLLPKIADSLFQVFRQADRCFLIQMGEGDRLQPRVVKTRRAADESSARFSKSIVRRCLESAQAFLSDDASRDDRIQLSQSVVDFRIRSVMCAPLCRANGQAFGVIQLDTQDRSKKFTQEDLKLLCAAANQATAALGEALARTPAGAWAETECELLREMLQTNHVDKTYTPVRYVELLAQLLDPDSPGRRHLADGFHRVVILDIQKGYASQEAFDFDTFLRYAVGRLVAAFDLDLASSPAPEDVFQILNDEPRSLLCFLNGQLAPPESLFRLRAFTQAHHQVLMLSTQQPQS